jgi:hypothetical protein
MAAAANILKFGEEDPSRPGKQASTNIRVIRCTGAAEG